MVGYSNYLIVLISSFVLLTSVSTSDRSKLSLKKSVIKADRGSPAFAAIEDLYSLNDLTVKPISESRIIKSIKLKKLKSVKLEGAKISLNDSTDFDKIDKTNFVKIALLGERIGVKHFTKKFIKSDLKVARLSDFKNTWGKSVTIASHNTSRVNDLTASPKRDLERLVSSDIFSRSKKKNQITNVGNTYIDNNESLKEESLTASAAVVVAPTNSRAEVLAASPSPNTSKQPKAARSTQSLKEQRKSFTTSASLVKRKMIRGQLILKDGDFTPGEDFIYYVERLFDGVVYESGVVDSESGVFEIEVESPRGIIYSELRNIKGEVLAYGELNLSKENNLSEISLELYPSSEDFSGRSLSHESFEDFEKPVAHSSQRLLGVKGELETDSEGYFNEQVFAKGSTYVASTHAEDFWSSLSIGVNGKPLYPKLYSKKHIKALSQLADPFGEEIEITSLITGRVTHAGLSQEGVSLKLYNAEYHKPLYFKNKIPAPNEIKTSEDGRFAFINLIDGDYLVQAFRNEKLLSQRWFKVERNHVSFGQLAIGKTYELDVVTSVFPENSKAIDKVEISEVGVDLYKDLDSSKSSSISLNLSSNPELTAIQSLETNFHKNQMVMIPSKAKFHHFIKVDKNWINSFLASRRSNANHSMAMIFGLFKKDAKKVVLEASSAKTKETKVYYFDERGISVDVPVVGGGFLLTDAPEGLNTLIFSNKNNSAFNSKLILSQKRSLSVIID